MWQYRNTDELYHYGIPGMRWGVRKRVPSDDYLRSRQIKKKKMKEMSTKEMKDLNDRLNTEKQYKQLNPNAGKQAVTGFIKAGATVAAVGVAYKTFKKHIDPVLNKVMTEVGNIKIGNIRP